MEFVEGCFAGGVVEMTDAGCCLRTASPFLEEALGISSAEKSTILRLLAAAADAPMRQCTSARFCIHTSRGTVPFLYVPLSISSGVVVQLPDTNSQQSGAGLESLLQLSPDAVLLVDVEGRVVRANDTAALLLDLQGIGAGQFLLGDLLAAETEEQTGMEQDLLELLLHSNQIICRPRRRQHGHVVLEASLREAGSGLLLCTLRDISERRLLDDLIGLKIEEINNLNVELQNKELELCALNQQLKELATTDSLTGVRNNRAFRERLDHECKRERRYGISLSLLMMDVDHFKAYNDQFGHPAGDDVLRMVGTILKRCIRNVDDVARYGGEEFAVILPHTNGEQARVVAERIREAIEAGPWSHRSVTVSIGISTWQPGTETVEQMISQADKALYHAKRTGRNRFVHIRDMQAAQAA
jgi:diguanylate cyclase (GGDEF)-like protein